MHHVDRNAARLAALHPWYAERIELARRLVHQAKAGNGGMQLGAHIVGPHGCTCLEAVNQECLHKLGWKLYTGGNE